MGQTLQRIDHDNGLTTLQSPRLREAGVPHAFSTRLGGASAGPYASLNLGSLEKDADTDYNTAVAENFRRLRRALGCERTVRLTVRQVHGSNVWIPPAQPVKPDDAPEADAMVTDQRGQLLTIRVADCVPVLLSAHDGQVVGAVHAGWRGIVAGVVHETLRTMQARFGVEAEDVIAATGPCISVDCYEVGDEVAATFNDAGLGACVHRNDAQAKAHIDLGGAVRHQLVQAGVSAERLDTCDGCTYRDRDLFYSYRRDGARSGRLAAVIGVSPPAP